MAGRTQIACAIAMGLVLILAFLSYAGLDSVTTSLRRLQAMTDMEGMATDSPVISLVGSSHYTFTDWQAYEGTWKHTHIFVRPGWHRTSRCSGGSSMDCVECSGNVDCWSGGENSRLLELSGQQPEATRYLSTIHLRCDSPTVKVQYEVKHIHDGRLRILWDGLDVSEQGGIDISGIRLPIVDDDGSYGGVVASGALDIVSERLGAHTLELEFVPLPGSTTAGVVLSKLQVAMPQEFAECADYKACLDPIARSSEFRNNNLRQMMCLQGLYGSADCALWRSCLSSEKQAELLHLMVAAGIGEDMGSSATPAPHVSDMPATPAAPSSAPTSAPSSILNGEEAHCINPQLQDPEMWSCDCLGEMKNVCADVASESTVAGIYSETLCLRAQMCGHPSICPGWKEHVCDEDEVQRMQKALDGVPARRALMSRRQHHVDGEVLDRALGGKYCA